MIGNGVDYFGFYKNEHIGILDKSGWIREYAH